MNVREFIAIVFLLLILTYPSLSRIDFRSLTSAIFFQLSITTEDIQDEYEDKELKVLIVPGHDSKNTGAVYYDVTEAEMNLRVANYLYNLMDDNENIEVMLARNEDGYHSRLQRYFDSNIDEIREFYTEKKEIMRNLIEEGEVDTYVNIHHNTASSEVVDILYGINKYASEKEFDLVIHIHFNDHPGRRDGYGKYNGYAIYVPEKQYSNAEASYDLAEYVSSRLREYLPVSSMPKEDDIVESQDLIAIGAHNTIDSASILIEYGYIYEKAFQDVDIRDEMFKGLARMTYNGVMDYVKEKRDILIVFPEYELNNYNFNIGDTGKDIFNLQIKLIEEGVYRVTNNCPLTGYYGNCTDSALDRYLDIMNIKE